MNGTTSHEPEIQHPSLEEKPGRPGSPPAGGDALSPGSTVLPALFLFLIGAVLGYLLGRQSALPTPSETAANLPGATAISAAPGAGLTPAAALPGASSLTPAFSSILAGPAPATISPEPLRTLGDPNAPVTIVEFSDYQCPFCLRHFQQTLPQLKAEYIDAGRVYYVFKDFPIASLHPQAARVHEAARCAGEIGGRDAYWQAHDAFFNGQAQWAEQPQPNLDDILLSLTGELELPEQEMRECLESGRYTDEVQADLAEGRALGVSGTPGFFINGYPIRGAQPLELFQQAIALAEAGQLDEAFARQPSPNDGIARATATAVAAGPVAVPLGDAPTLGDPNAPVIMVEYSDFQCPFCLRHFQQTWPQLQPYIAAGQVRYVFKDFPIHSLHPQAQKAHEAARCARELGGDEAFWTMHDLLFFNQQQWANQSNHVEIFKALARQAGLLQADFDACLDSGRYFQAVNAGVSEGLSFNVNGTPTFFINGQRLVGAQPFAVFQQAIEALLTATE
ncbi:MAG: thioredoxin domain-containing protein [Candidatus Promineifilaceae bacterium]